MTTSRIEELASYCWAKDICISQIKEFSLEGGKARVLEMLSRGLVQKPFSYAVGVQKFVEAVKTVPEITRIAE